MPVPEIVSGLFPGMCSANDPMGRHANLFQAIGELYNTFVELAIIPPSALQLPDATTGVNGLVNVEKMLEAGFTQGAIEVAQRLPYLDLDQMSKEEIDLYPVDSGGFQIMCETISVNYAVEDANAGDYEWLRSMDDEPDNPEYKIPGSSLRLSEHEGNGITLIYDTETRLMRAWSVSSVEPLGDGDDEQSNLDDWKRGYTHLPAKLPTEILQPVMRSWRNLGFFNVQGISDFESDDLDVALWHRDDEELRQATEDFHHGRRQIRQIYIECGWESGQARQPMFDKDRFVKLRKYHVKHVVKPLYERMVTLRHNNILRAQGRMI